MADHCPAHLLPHAEKLRAIEALEPDAISALVAFKLHGHKRIRDICDSNHDNDSMAVGESSTPEAPPPVLREYTIPTYNLLSTGLLSSLPYCPPRRRPRLLPKEEPTEAETTAAVATSNDNNDAAIVSDTSMSDTELTFPSTLYTTGEEDHINPVHTIIRRDILEVFVEKSTSSSSGRIASPPGSSVHASLRARQTRFSNKVGLRCRFCKHLPDEDKSPLSAVFPETLAGLYRACCVRFQKRHLSHCSMIPVALLEELEDLKETSKSRGSKKYWEESAYEKGLRNSEEEKGIIFCAEVGMS